MKPVIIAIDWIASAVLFYAIAREFLNQTAVPEVQGAGDLLGLLTLAAGTWFIGRVFFGRLKSIGYAWPGPTGSG